MVSPKERNEVFLKLGALPPMKFVNQLLRPVIIIGMHRSGSSMLSRILNRSGIFMGLFQEHNAEALRFLKINQLLLKEHGGSWLEPVQVRSSQQVFASNNLLYREHFKLGIESEWYRRWLYNYCWGWKDPRNTFTLPFWLERFPQARVLHIHRDGRQVAMSLFRRNQREGEVNDVRLNDPLFGFALWECYMEQIDRLRKSGVQFIDIEYEALTDATSSTVRKIERHLKHPLRIEPSGPSSWHDIPEALEELASKSVWMKQYGYL